MAVLRSLDAILVSFEVALIQTINKPANRLSIDVPDNERNLRKVIC